MRVRGSKVLAVLGALAAVVAMTAAPAHAQKAGSDERVPTVSGPVTGGKGMQALGIGYDFPSFGYMVEEYFVSGDAAGYQRVGEFASNGKWKVQETPTAPYTTRVIVVRPASPKDFNGTVYVEWHNVTGGVDTGATFLMGHNEIFRSGAAWVGVTAQSVGVNGGTDTVQSTVVDIPQGGLKKSDPVRYGTLNHPGDLYSYDIFSQVGRAIRGDGHGVPPLGSLHPKRLFAMGESQSAGRLVTYIDAVHPGAGVYDGFLVHSRGASAAPLGTRPANTPDPDIPAVVHIRSDLDVPVFTFETEYDVYVGQYADARQPDTNRFRLWEVAGTSHIDAYTGGGYSLNDLGDGKAEAALIDPRNPTKGLLTCAQPLNAGSQHGPLTAALDHLDTWVRKGTAPPKFPRLVTTGAGTSIQVARDDLGIARGGVRTPIVEVPLAVNVGDATNTPNFCRVFGYTRPLDSATLARLYPKGTSEYHEKFDKAAAHAVKSGIWLEPEADNFTAGAAKVSIG